MRSSASTISTHSCCQRTFSKAQFFFRGNFPFQPNCTTRAPASSAIACVPSVLAESTTTISSANEAPTRAPARRLARSLSNLAFFSFARRVPDHNAPGSYVLHRYRSCTNDGPFADCHARPHERIRTDPRLGADRNRRTQQRKIGLGVIMCSCAKMSAVRDCCARTQRHAAEIVNKRMLADGAFISRLEVPREINRRRRIHMNIATNFCSETTKQKSPPAETRPGTEPKKWLGESPQHAADNLAR